VPSTLWLVRRWGYDYQMSEGGHGVETTLDLLEAEAMWILRETAGAFARPVMLYSIGKDSTVMLHLARKAFAPGAIPFPLLHVDTTWKFHEMIEFRDRVSATYRCQLLVAVNERAVAAGVSPFTCETQEYTRIMKTVPLREALDRHGFDAALGGSRRDEERSRAKERVFSVREPGHRWEPRRQRPELGRTANTRLARGQTMRVFPLSNWTELDVWRYVEREGIPVVQLYLARHRPVVARRGQWIAVDDDRFPLHPGERPQRRLVRFRSLGCYPLTAAVESDARDVHAVVAEVAATHRSERGGRFIDGEGEASMEAKKVEGYF
jgi:sulfate adenylyltransferase subunit 2